jgi:hypothetical protein
MPPTTKSSQKRDVQSRNVHQLTVRLSDGDVDSLKSLAESEQSTANAALKKAIATEAYIKKKQEEGATILVREPDGTLKEVVFR